MATRTLLCIPNNSVTAQWQAWVNEFDAALIAYGWLRSGDTGEASMPTAVTRPTTTATWPIWVVYKMNDSLQSTTAVYMRIDYGTGGQVDTPSIKFQITIGGTNGSGTLTGNVSTQQTFSGQSPPSTATPFRTSGSSSSFRLLAWTKVAGQSWAICVERDKDSSGADTTSGVNYVVAWCSNNVSGVGLASQYLALSGGNGLLDTSRFYAMITSSPSQTWNSLTGVAPIRTSFGPFRNPMIGIVMTARPDFADGVTNPVTIYGATHTYMMGALNTTGQSLNQWNSDSGLGILWE
jgi:hypothetical protein